MVYTEYSILSSRIIAGFQLKFIGGSNTQPLAASRINSAGWIEVVSHGKESKSTNDSRDPVNLLSVHFSKHLHL